MQKAKTYQDARFDAETIKKALDQFRSDLDKKDDADLNKNRSVNRENVEWKFDSDDEFFVEYQLDHDDSYFWEAVIGQEKEFSLSTYERRTIVKVRLPERAKIESIFQIFESDVSNAKLPPEPKPSPIIFIGHGRSKQWRDLKDHLTDQHNYRVEAYEIGARAGHGIRDILEEMLKKSSIAFLVMTGEDELGDGELRARQNVIHEAGLFQGRLGFSKGIILLEEGVSEFSNIHGVIQIRFGKGNIRETFGDVLATIKRESPD